MAKRSAVFTLVFALFALVQGAWADVVDVSTAGQLNSAIGSGAGTKSVRLVDDITLSAYLKIGESNNQTVTIDLNGHTLQRTGLAAPDANGHVIEVFSKGNLTIADNSENHTGKITGGWANNGGGICNYGTLTITGGTITGNKAKSGGGIKNNDGATLNIQGKVIISGNSVEALENNVYLATGTVINVTGPLDAGSKIGVNRDGNTGAVTSGLSDRGGLSNFFSDFSPAVTLSLVDGEATLAASSSGVPFVKRDWDGSKVTAIINSLSDGHYTELTGNDASRELQLEADHWYVVKNSGVKYKRLIASSDNSNPAQLILCDGAELTAQITINSGKGLIIYGQTAGTGKLVATGENYVPGIGSNDYSKAMGGLQIHGGVIVAKGGKYAAGIGGAGSTNEYTANSSDGGTVHIYGGSVTAEGGVAGAGIGGGTSLSENGNSSYYGGNGGALYVYGGSVTATGARYAAGIGGGYGSKNNVHGGSLYVYDGATVKAQGGDYGAGIGGGENGNGGNVTIYGGMVEANGGTDAAGIGSGEQENGSRHGGSLTVSGGKVTATGKGHGAGIGGGQDASGATVTIYGGSVTATGGTDAAGIGSGERYTASSINGGSLTVNGGYVFADGTGWGAGIGGGEDANGANVVINGGTVVAWAGEYAGKKNGSAIGSEDGDGHYGSLSINGNVTVYAGSGSSSVSRFPYSTRVPACRWRPYARIEPCVHSYTYTIDKNSNPSTHTMTCKYCGHSETHEHTYESNGICGVCGYNGGDGYWTVTISKPEVNESGEPQSLQGGGVAYSGVDYTVGKGKSFLLPSCDVQVNGYRFKGWVENSTSTSLEAANGATFLDPDNDSQNAVTVNDNVIYKAHYGTVKVVTVSEAGSSEPNGGYATYTDTVLTGSDYTFPPAHGVDGYEFVGWYVGSIEDLVNGGYSLKPSINNPTFYQPDAKYESVSADFGIVAVYRLVSSGAITIDYANSKATIDGAYTGTDVANIPMDITVNTVVLDRTFTEGAFSTVVLPFSVALSNVNGAKFYGLSEMTQDANGKWTAGATAVSGTLQPNTPYLVNPTATTITFTGPVTLRTVKNPSTSIVPWEFRGTYGRVEFGDSSATILGKAYGFVAKDTTINGTQWSVGQFAKAGSGAYIPPMRAYLVYNDANSNAKDAGGLGLGGAAALPDVIEVKIMDEQGKVTETVVLNPATGAISKDRWFDVQGRELKAKPTIKGRYLHNGKIEVVK